jgi:crotonobetainyl-CoA:carnitine CoA-transferase CaiB-like acyl-CoA transferase
MAMQPQSPQVLEWGGSLACAYAGKLLVEAGIPVVRVVQPEREPAELKSNPWFEAFLNGGKTTVVLGTESSSQLGELEAHVRGSSLLLVGETGPESAGLDAALVAKLATVAITPFGVEGLYAGCRAGDLELSAYSGLSYLTPRDIAKIGDGREQPPLKMPGVLPSIYAGAAGAAACLIALLEPKLFEGRQLDVSAVETLIPTLRRELALYQYQSVVASRFMRVWQLAPWGVKPCRDGFVFVQVVEEHHWRGLVEMMGSPEWAREERYCDPNYRFEHRHHIEAQMAPWLMQVTKGWFAWECQKRGLPFAPVNTVADVVRIPQLHFRQFFTSARSEQVGPCTVPRLPYVVREAAARGEATNGRRRELPKDPRLPLAGVRVADFGHVWAGPYCTQILADLGAEVIKIESAKRLDIHRRQGPYPGGAPGINASGVWNSQNRGKGSATFDLTTNEGRELAKAFVAHCDVVVENFAPGVMRKLGLDYETLSAMNPSVIMASLSAFGQDGPQKHNVGYGPSLDAWSGLDAQTAYDAAHPGPLGGVFPDTGSAIHGAVAILQGILDRETTGRGRYIDVSELEVSVLLLADLLCEQLGSGAIAAAPGNAHIAHFPYGVFPCAGDDEWIALTVATPGDWAALCALIGEPAWATAPQYATADDRRSRKTRIEAAITAWTAQRSARSCMRALQDAGVRAAVVNKVPDILSDEHLASRGYFQTVNHPVAGPLQVYGSLWKVRGMERHTIRAAPVLGDATDRVLKDMLGYDPEMIEDLKARKIAC